jgi:hypothetical protein
MVGAETGRRASTRPRLPSITSQGFPSRTGLSPRGSWPVPAHTLARGPGSRARRRLGRTAELLALRGRPRPGPQVTLVIREDAGPNRLRRVARGCLERSIAVGVARHREPPPRPGRWRQQLLFGTRVRATGVLEPEGPDHWYLWRRVMVMAAPETAPHGAPARRNTTGRREGGPGRVPRRAPCAPRASL